MGKNTLGCLAKTMSDKAGFSERHTNHSGRKTCITNLIDAEVPTTEVAQLSGHKNFMSLKHYNTVGIEKQIKMSTVLHSKTSGSNKAQADVTTSNTNSDEELLTASQELEFTLKTIEHYENNQSTNALQPTFADTVSNEIINIATVHATSGISGLNSQSAKPSARGANQFPVPYIPVFSNCTFSCPVNIK